MDVYEVAECIKQGSASVLSDAEGLIEEMYCTNDNQVIRYLAYIINRLAERTDEKPENILCHVLGALSDESIYYAHVLLKDSQGTRLAGDLPKGVTLEIKNDEQD